MYNPGWHSQHRCHYSEGPSQSTWRSINRVKFLVLVLKLHFLHRKRLQFYIPLKQPSLLECKELSIRASLTSGTFLPTALLLPRCIPSPTYFINSIMNCIFRSSNQWCLPIFKQINRDSFFQRTVHPPLKKKKPAIERVMSSF